MCKCACERVFLLLCVCLCILILSLCCYCYCYCAAVAAAFAAFFWLPSVLGDSLIMRSLPFDYAYTAQHVMKRKIQLLEGAKALPFFLSLSLSLALARTVCPWFMARELSEGLTLTVSLSLFHLASLFVLAHARINQLAASTARPQIVCVCVCVA